MKKRLIDIYPPHSRNTASLSEELQLTSEEKISESGEQRGLRTIVFVAFLILLFAIPPVFAHLFFASAQIHLWPQITKLHLQEQINAQVGYDKVNLETNIIRARVFEEEKELTQLFRASGKKFKQEKARGAIRVYNENSPESQTLVANTRFISEDGLVFRLQTTASIPAKGFFDVQVVAADSGSEYNIGPSKFSLPGLVGSPLYTKIYGESFQEMSGGIEQEVAVVTEEDIAAAKDQLAETLKAQATKSLLAQIPPEFQVFEHSLGSTILEDNSLVKPGAELEQFNYIAKIKVSVSGFHKDDADLLVRRLLRSYLDPNQEINEETLQITYTASEDETRKGVIPLTAQIMVDQYEKVDAEKFGELVEGATVGELREVMKEHPFLAKVQFSLWPFWVAQIPQNSRRVNIDVRLDS